MYSVAVEMVEALSALLQGYCLQYFFGEFLPGRLSKKGWNGLAVAALFGVLKLGMKRYLDLGYGSAAILGKQAVEFVLLYVLALCFYRAVHATVIFVVITYMAVSEIIFFLTYMILVMGQHLTDLWVELWEKGCFSSSDTFLQTVEISLTGLQLLAVLMFGLLLYMALRKIAESYREKEYALHRKQLAFILTPGLAGLLLCVLLRMIMITVEGDVPRLLYDRYPPLLWLVPVILLLSLSSILYGVKLLQDMIDLNREKNSRIILEKQVRSMQEHIREMEHIYSGIRSMKHDMKNTLSVIIRLAGGKGGEDAQLQAYLSQLNQTMDRLEFRFKTGNAVVDTLLNMKYHEAVRKMPDLQMDAEHLLFPASLLIQSYDIGIILGNALDNAIEACERLKEKEPEAEPFIRLSSTVKGKMFLMEIENSFDGNILRKPKWEFPATDKPDKEAHGIGLTNVRNAAEKYHGAVDWSVNHKVFTLSIMMQNERSRDDED